MIVAEPGEVLLFEQEIFFDSHQYGSDTPILFGSIQIQRSSDNLFWDGLAWGVLATQPGTTVGASGTFHSYTFTAGADGESYTVRLRVHNDEATAVVFGVLVRASASAAVELETVFDGVSFATGLDFTVRVAP